MNKHFEEYNEIDNRIKELNYKLEVIKTELYTAKGISYDLMPSGTLKGDNLIYKIAEKDEITQEIKKLQIEKQSIYDKHIKEISLLSDPRYRQIIRCKYLLKLTNNEMCELLNCCESNFRRLRKQAIIEFKSIVRGLEHK